MKRALLVAALVVSLAGVEVAIASATDYVGNLREGHGSLSFEGQKKHGKVIKVNHFFVLFAPLHCDNGKTTISSDRSWFTARVRHRHFHDRATFVAGGHAVLDGRFTHSHYRQAKGTLEFTGDFSATETNCSATDHWKVKRMPRIVIHRAPLGGTLDRR